MKAWVYLLKGTTGRHYIGYTSNLKARLEAHHRGNTATTRRLGYPLELVAAKIFKDEAEARAAEKKLKSWKNPNKAKQYLSLESSPDPVGVG